MVLNPLPLHPQLILIHPWPEQAVWPRNVILLLGLDKFLGCFCHWIHMGSPFSRLTGECVGWMFVMVSWRLQLWDFCIFMARRGYRNNNMHKPLMEFSFLVLTDLMLITGQCSLHSTIFSFSFHVSFHYSIDLWFQEYKANLWSSIPGQWKVRNRRR